MYHYSDYYFITIIFCNQQFVDGVGCAYMPSRTYCLYTNECISIYTLPYLCMYVQHILIVVTARNGMVLRAMLMYIYIHIVVYLSIFICGILDI